MTEKQSKKDYQKLNGIYGLNKMRIKAMHIIARYMLIPSIRNFLYRSMGIKIGKNVFIGIETFIDDEAPGLITIEENVVIAFRSTIVAHDDTSKTVAPINIRKGAYIGTGAIITMGVEIGQNATVGAGAVVTKDVAAGDTVVGVPAKPINK